MPIGTGIGQFYKWLRAFLEKNQGLKPMVHRILVGPQSAKDRAIRE